MPEFKEFKVTATIRVYEPEPDVPAYVDRLAVVNSGRVKSLVDDAMSEAFDNNLEDPTFPMFDLDIDTITEVVA